MCLTTPVLTLSGLSKVTMLIRAPCQQQMIPDPARCSGPLADPHCTPQEIPSIIHYFKFSKATTINSQSSSQ